MFHALASDALFAAAFAGWAVLLTRAILRPSTLAFLLTGAGMGLLVLVRPVNQALIAMALLPLVLRVPWQRRFTWVAALFVASAAVTQGWKAIAHLRWGDAVGLRPSLAVIGTSLLLCVFFVPRTWRRWIAVAAVPVLLVGLALKWSDLQSPGTYLRSVAQGPGSGIFLFRTFEVDRIVEPDNGPASGQLAEAVERELLDEEPYRSYGVDLDEFFSSGSDRVFVDLTSLSAHADLTAVTEEAIREHPGAFASGIAGTVWEMLWSSRVYAPEPAEASPPERRGGEDLGLAEVGNRGLPPPSEGQPIPASRVGPAIRPLYGGVREVWVSPTDHHLVFDDPRDQARYERFDRETNELVGRIPTRDSLESGLIHRMNQASYRYPAPFVWLAIGTLAMAIRRPRYALVAIAPSAAGLVVVAVTGAVILAVGEYVVPVTPAFVVLAAAGLLGAHPRGRLRLQSRRSVT